MGKTIPCHEDTKRRLEKYGNKSETWDDLLNRIADEAGVPEG
jgi:hypothetical protein